MALTWDQFGNLGLTAGQKTKLAQAAAIGNSLRSSDPDTSALTLSQAKAIRLFIIDVNTLLGPAWQGVQYIREKTMRDAAKAADDASPPGTL
jgi:hypothetical protein